jgi:hypothetical protein
MSTERRAALRAVASDPPRGPIRLHQRSWRREDLDGAALAVGAIVNRSPLVIDISTDGAAPNLARPLEHGRRTG